jgi:hypothetical protein
LKATEIVFSLLLCTVYVQLSTAYADKFLGLRGSANHLGEEDHS